ncbi:lmo0937 family membrane protein [Cytobacillus horneckiae]|uniref:lmo0937 family membrane protein n=1 Tax=Cytobacillus horneckiae TaxID=549687 RepID=UPI003D9A11CB
MSNGHYQFIIERKMNMLWTLIGILIILWILGFSFDIAGGLVHLLLVIALIVLIFQMITGRKRS